MYYAGEPYGSVLAQFKALLNQPEFFGRLTGAQGCGKSALLEQAVQHYQQQGYLTRYFPANPDSPTALRSALRKSLGLPKTHNFQRNLQDHLSHEALTHKGIVLVFDDCHLMNNATLLEVTKLTDIQISNSCMLSIIMCGSDTLDERLKRDHELRPVLQRITLSSHLTPLDKKGTALFLQKLFDNANQQDLIFEPQALTLLFDVSKGLPQRVIEIGMLSSNLYRSQELSTPVGKTDLIQVLKHPSLAMPRYTSRRPTRDMAIAATGIAATLLIAVAATAFLMLQPTPATVASDTTVASASTPIPPLPGNTMPPLGDIDGINDATLDAEPPVVAETEPVQAVVPQQISSDQTAMTMAAPEVEPELELEPEQERATDVATPVIAEQPEPAIESADNVTEPDSAEQTLQRWIAAWQSRDVDAYFSFYHNDFFPRGFDSVSAWQENRRRNIANRDWIEMQISELSVNDIAERTTQLEFWLDYQSPGYSDRTQKQVLMRLGDQGWQIVQEINLEIIYL